MQFFLRAAEKGHELVQYKLATCYETGKYIEKNIAQAYKWYKRCADQGNAEAAYKVAIVYEWVKYHEKAAHWYEQAANKGYKGALYGQARMLANLKQHQKAHALFMVSFGCCLWQRGAVCKCRWSSFLTLTICFTLWSEAGVREWTFFVSKNLSRSRLSVKGGMCHVSDRNLCAAGGHHQLAGAARRCRPRDFRDHLEDFS